MSLKFAPVKLAPLKFASRRSLFVRSQFYSIKTDTSQNSIAIHSYLWNPIFANFRI